MADETPRSSNRTGKSKSFFKGPISNLPESPLGATPRPDLYQHYPAPPPSAEFQSVRVREVTSEVNVSNNEVGFTNLKKSRSEFKQVHEWNSNSYQDLKPAGSTRKALLILSVLFLVTLLALGLIYSRFSTS